LNGISIKNLVAEKQVSQIVIGHKDRLCRFGFDFKPTSGTPFIS
jgi:predicted site-specific integrase-resolvase